MITIYTSLADKMNKLFSTLFKISFVLSLLFVSAMNSFGQLSVTTEGSPFTINFDATVSGVNNGQFNGSGFTPTPSTGQINSDAFSITGLSDGTLSFGGTQTTTSTDFTRGMSNGGVTTGGIYAFTVGTGNNTLGFQPTGPDMTPGDIILKITNNTGGDVATIDLSYEIWQFNDQNRSTSLNFSYSPDNSTFISVPILNFTSVEAGTPPNPPIPPGPSWAMTAKTYTIDLNAAPLADGADFYLKWTTDDFGGTNNRDELALDDISVTMNEPVPPDNDSEVQTIGGYQPASADISSLNITEEDAVDIFWFQIQDLGTSDGLPTKVETIRLVPGILNDVVWSTQIQGITMDDFFGSFYSIQSIEVTDSYIDVSFALNEINIPNNSTSIFRIYVYLNYAGIEDDGSLQFQIDTDPTGFTTYPGGSGFAPTFPAAITSNIQTIDVEATELRFVQEPINADTYIPMGTDVSIQATDINGNRDLGFTDNIALSSDGTMTGDPISVAAVSGLATWAEAVDPIIHTDEGIGLILTGSSAGLIDAVSNGFDINQTANQVAFTSYPTQGQRNQTVAPIVVSALRPDMLVDDSFTGNITISVNSGPGAITGTLTKAAVAGVATFNDIKFNTNGDYTLLATGAAYMSTAVSGTVSVSPFFQGFTTCPPAGWLSVIINGNGWACGSGYASVNGIGGAVPTEAWYVAPSLNYAALTTPVLSFNSWTSGTDAAFPQLEVLYSTNYSGVGNPNVATWNSLTYSPSTENSGAWAPSGTIDLSGIGGSAYIAFKYTSSGTSSGTAAEWRIDNVSVTENGCSAPTVQPSNPVFSNIAVDGMTLTWDNGDGKGRIVLAREGSAVSETPTNGTNYSSNSAYGTSGTEIGSSFVVYKGTGNSVTLTGMAPNTEYFYSVFEYNCNDNNPTFNTGSPLTASQFTVNPNASDIIVTPGFTYPENIAYGTYQATALTMSPGNSLSVFGLTLRDGGATMADDGLPTTLTSITISQNGSTAIRGAAIYYGGVLLDDKVYVNGSTTDMVFDLSSNPIAAANQGTADFELYVTFMAGDFIIDNAQQVFTVTFVTADPSGTLFSQANGGGAQSIEAPSGTGNENVIRVVATTLKWVEVPNIYIPLNEDFTIEVEAVDALDSRDLNKSLTIFTQIGTGILSSASGLTKSTADSTALWTDLVYDKEEIDIKFRVTDGGSPALIKTTAFLDCIPRITIYTFTGATGSEATFPPDHQPADGTVSVISRGINIIPVNRANAFSARSWPLAGEGIDTEGSYYEFSVTADPGYSFNISSIEFDNRRSATGPIDWQMRNSTDGFSSSIGLTMADVTTWNRNDNVPVALLGENDVTFRIYAFNAEGNNGNWAVDNIEIFGDIYDSQPPSFTMDFPASDSTSVDGFDLIVNLDEAAVAYYVVQNPSIAAPDLDQVKNGLNGDGIAAEAADTINVNSPLTAYTKRIQGLNSDTGYNVYWVLDDGTYYKPLELLVFPQTGLRTADTNSDISTATQPGGSTISSLVNDASGAVQVLSFTIDDSGMDGAPTNVTKLVFNVGAGNNVPDWQTTIAGISLFNETGVLSVPIENLTINSNSIEAEIAVGSLSVANGTSEVITMSVWLTETVTDNEDLAFEIGGAGHTDETYFIGSQFNSTLNTVSSDVFTIDVVADRLTFSVFPLTPVTTSEEFSLTVIATDANGNQDIDDNTTVVDLTRDLGSGALTTTSSPTAPQMTMTGGAAVWTDILYDGTNEFFTITASDNNSVLLPATTSVLEVGDANDLIVTTGNTVTLSTNLTFNNVTVQPGGTLNLSSDINLTVQADLTVDGTFNDLGGTTIFDGTSSQSILSNVLNKTVTFYNITVNNTDLTGVVSDINVNLTNTLKINTAAVIDVDGTGDNKNFTLISTPTATARIDKIEDGGTLNGQIVWQRSLRTGPAGWRYIGTPTKGQKLSNISDDVWIQGVTGRYPTAWTNIAVYNEPYGTNGQLGFDGWVNFTSLTQDVETATGMKLWQWASDYVTEQVIVNKGAPNIGDGVDNVAGTGESFVLPISFTTSSYDGGGWNFFANPYPCELDWDAVTMTDLSGGAVYIWNPNTQQYGTYASGIGLGGVSQYVASGQGFFVKANSGTSTLSVSESSKSSMDGNSFLRKSNEETAKIHVKIISPQGKEDETAVAFSENATDGYDPTMDAVKLSGGYVNLSTKLDNDKLIAINSMGAARGVQSVKLNIDSRQYGNYKMSFPTITEFSEGTVLRLKDKFLDKTTIINSASKYDFMIEQNNQNTFGSERFELQFVSPVILRMENMNAKSGREFVMPVYADQLADITETKLALAWDNAALTFVGIDDAGTGNMSDFDLSMTESGKLYFTNSNSIPIDLQDGTKLFSVRFKANNGQAQAQLRFERASIRIKAIDEIEMPFSAEDVTIHILQNKFISGTVLTYGNTPVSEVSVSAQGEDEEIQKITNNSGDFMLDAFEQTGYTLSASKSDNNPLKESVTILDIIKSRRHLLQIDEFTSPYQVIAADVNGSKSITALDLVEMRKVVLGISQSFSSGLNWLFVPESSDLGNNPFAFETMTEIATGDQDIQVNFKGIKVGDVDNSWSEEHAGRTNNGKIELNFENIILENESVEIPISVKDFNDISGYQFSITWDPTQLEYAGVSDQSAENYFNEQLTADGILTTAWDESAGKSVELENGTILFILKFTAKEKDAKSQVELNSALTEAIAYDSRLNSISIKSKSLNVDLNELRNGALELYQNVPNPFDNQTEIQFKIAKKGKAQFTIVNLLGEIIFIHEQDYEPGVHELSWNRNQSSRPITPGVYLYRLQSNGEEVVKKLMIQ